MPTYLSNGDSFKIVADAIREKGKTTELLEFPNGMAEAVRKIKSGSIFIFQESEICNIAVSKIQSDRIFIFQAVEICNVEVSTYYKEES